MGDAPGQSQQLRGALSPAERPAGASTPAGGQGLHSRAETSGLASPRPPGPSRWDKCRKGSCVWPAHLGAFTAAGARWPGSGQLFSGGVWGSQLPTTGGLEDHRISLSGGHLPAGDGPNNQLEDTRPF